MNPISFAEIVKGRESTVKVSSDGLLCSADVVMVMTGKNSNHSNETLRDLSPSLFDSKKFVMKGRSRYLNFKDSISLIMILPGAMAKETRGKFADIIAKYWEGNASLIAEINANAASNSPIAQLARASMVQAMSPEDLLEKKRKREIEDAELQSRKLGNVKLFADTMSLINPFWSNDARLRLQTEDWLKNVAFNSQPAITNGAEIASQSSIDSQSIYVCEVAKDLGAHLSHGQSIQVGRMMAMKFQEKYGAKPPKIKRWVDGAERDVCSYTERDRGMLVDVLKGVGVIA
jgi:hypothetical protein